MRRLLPSFAAASALALGALSFAAPARAQTPFPEINAAAASVSTRLLQYARCQEGNAPRVGIWPLKGDTLPIDDPGAIALYEAVFAALNATRPDCVTFVDGAGGGGTVRYFMLVGGGAEARARVDEAFRETDFILTLDIFDRGGQIKADIKLTDAGGATVAAPAAFNVDDEFIITSCAAGALPLSRAVRVASRTLLERAPDLTTLVNQGGSYANSAEAPSFVEYFAQLMIDGLADRAVDTLSGRTVREAGAEGLEREGAYGFSFRYWPCSDGSATEISARLATAEGQTATWRGKIRLDQIPGSVEVFPAGVGPAPEGPGGAGAPDEVAVAGNDQDDGPAPEIGDDPDPDAATAAGGADASETAGTDTGTIAGPAEDTAEGTAEDTTAGTEEDGTAGSTEDTAAGTTADSDSSGQPQPVARIEEPTGQPTEPKPVVGTDPQPTPVPQPQPQPALPVDPPAHTAPAPAPFFSLSFSPRNTHVGDVVSIVADIAQGCDPFFLDLTEAGDGQVVPLDVFETTTRQGGTEYRVDSSTPVGLKITPADTKGVHFVGYVCTEGGAMPQSDQLRDIHAGLRAGTYRRTDPSAGPVFWFERYVIN